VSQKRLLYAPPMKIAMAVLAAALSSNALAEDLHTRALRLHA